MASKNQRVVKGNTRELTSDHRAHLIPLNGGRHAYVTVEGKIRHVATDSEAFNDAVRELGEAAAPKVAAEIERFATLHPDHGWDATLERLRAAGVL